MGGFDVAFQRELAFNTWILFTFAMATITLRYIAQVCRVGFSGLKLDDALMVFAALLYILLVVSLNFIAMGGGSNLFLPEEFPTFSPHEIQERIKGSKIVIVSEQAMLNVIYVLKWCLLVLYGRLTRGTTDRQWQVRGVKYYVLVAYVATQIAFFTACRPFHGYWAVPPPNPQCTTLQIYAIVQAILNISGDLMMLAISVSMIVTLQRPLKQKIGLTFVLGLGIFVIIAAVLTKVYNLMDVYSPNYMIWYTREASVAIYVANLPFIYCLLRDNIRFLRESVNRSHRAPPPASSTETPSIEMSRGVRSMNAYHSSVGDIESAPESNARSAASRGRTMTRKGDSIEIISSPARQSSKEVDLPGRFSGEAFWDGRILAKTTINVDEFTSHDLDNSDEQRQKYPHNPPLDCKFESDQEQWGANHEVTVQDGYAVPEDLFKTARNSSTSNKKPGMTVYDFLKETGPS